MFSRITGLCAASVLVLAGCTTEESGAPASMETMSEVTASADEILADVVAAMGTGSLESITFSGRAWRIRNGWMQTPTASPPWPWRDEITNYRRTIDLGASASQARGDTFASDIFLNPPTAGTYTQNISIGDGTAWSQQLEYYLTPWGFLEGAAENGVELSTGMLDGVDYQVLTWQSPEDVTSPSGMRYTVNAYIDDANRIAGVETWVDDPFMGDFHVVQIYGNYREEDGVMVPQTIEQQRGGGGVFGVIVADADANPTNLSELMPAQGGGGRGGFFGGFGGGGDTDPADLVEPIGDNAWIVTGAYTALVVEFEDHLMVFEAGMNEALGDTILAAIDAALPDKPIRYIVNSHPHSDHTGGIVPFLRRGISLITHENNVEFMDMALNTPRTLLGESNLNATVEGVSGVAVYEDSLNRLELHSVPNRHTDGMLVAVLPNQGVMFQADFTLPNAGAEANEYVVGLAEYVAANDIQFDTYLAVHAATVPQSRDDLLATIGQ